MAKRDPPTKARHEQSRVAEGSSFARPAALILLAALAIRVLHLWQLRHSPLFEVYLGDAAGYHAWALRIAGGDWLGTEVFYQAPLYPYTLGAIYSLFGDGWPVRAAQALIGSLACVFLALAARRLFSRRAGLAAGFGLALYPTAVFFDGLIQKSVLDGFLLCLLLWLFSRQLVEARGVAGWAWVGVALGVLALSRENALVLLLPIGAGLLFDRRLERPRRAKAALLLAAGLALPLGTVALRNSWVGGGLHLTTSQAGPNFYIGNNSEASGIYEPLRYGRGDAQWERTDATELAEQALGAELTPTEVSAYWMGKALDDIRAEPVDWLRLMAKKAMLTWNGAEVEDTEDQATYAEQSLFLRLAGLFHFGIIAPLAALGVWLTRERWRTLWPLYGMILVYSGSVALFFVAGRYRYPLVPMLGLFAAVAVTEGIAYARRAPRVELVKCAASLLVITALCNVPLFDPGRSEVTTQINLGKAFRERGDLDRAAEHLERALKLEADHPLAHSNLGSVRKLQGRTREAIGHYLQALAQVPGDVESLNNLGVALEAEGDLAGAIERYREAARLDPRHPEALTNLAGGLARTGNIEQALTLFVAALEVNPGHLRAYVNKAKVLAGAERFEEAAAELAVAVSIAPNDSEIHRLLGSVAARQDDLDASVRHYERAAALDPDHAPTRFDLGRTLATVGKFDAALPHLRAAARIQPSVPHLNTLAWILATRPGPAAGDAKEAARVAEQAVALSGGRDAAVLRVLATARAALGDYAGAAATALQALTLAQRAGSEQLAEILRQQLELYRQNSRQRP